MGTFKGKKSLAKNKKPLNTALHVVSSVGYHLKQDVNNWRSAFKESQRQSFHIPKSNIQNTKGNSLITYNDADHAWAWSEMEEKIKSILHSFRRSSYEKFTDNIARMGSCNKFNEIN